MMRYRFWMLSAAILMIAIAAAPPACSEEVWALRTRFTVSVNEADIDYAEEDAEWRIKFNDGHIAAENVSFAVELADGTVLHGTDLTHDNTEREVVETPFGDGTRCVVHFAPENGLSIEHSLTLFKNRPFVLLGMAATNAGDSPVTVKRFVPVLAGPGQLPGLGPSTVVTRYPIRIQGGEPVLDPSGPPAWVRFHDPVSGRAVALGLIPTGDTEGGALLDAAGGTWEGQVYFDHSPGVRLDPGERVDTGSVWLSAGVTEPEQMALYYGWAFTLGHVPEKPDETPRAWVTVPDTEGLNDLLKTARAHQSGIRCALIPASWEGRPGSMRGGAPGYPRDMGSAARQLADMNIAPGLAIDPLAADGGKQDWLVTTADGQTWLNPSDPDAAESIRDRISQAIRWGFQFIAVAPSAIPDEGLEAMNLSRAGANALALRLTREAAGNVPVVVAGSGVPLSNPTDWRLVADAMKPMRDYGAVPAAMRIDANALDSLTEEGIAALRDWTGPIEVVGTGKSAFRRELSRDVLAGRGGPPPRIQPTEDTAALGEEEVQEPDEQADIAADTETGDPAEEPVQKAESEGKGLFRGIKNFGKSIF